MEWQNLITKILDVIRKAIARVFREKDTKDVIAEAIKQAHIEAAEIYDERWVQGRELCQEISMFSTDWLEKFGWKLPRERIEVTDDEGKTRVTRWGYPLHQIKRMVATGHTKF